MIHALHAQHHTVRAQHTGITTAQFQSLCSGEFTIQEKKKHNNNKNKQLLEFTLMTIYFKTTNKSRISFK